MRTSLGTHAVVALIAVVLSPAAGAAQVPVRVVDGDPTCGDCRIVFDTVAIVGAIEDSVLISDRPGGVLVVSGDTVIIGGSRFEPRTLVFAPDGRLDRTIGNVGQGPGELWGQIGVADHVDRRILVIQAARVSVMDLDGVVRDVRRHAIRSISSLSTAPDGRVLYGFPESDPEAVGLRYKIFAPNLTRLHAFDPIEPSLRECTDCVARFTAWSVTKPGQFWSVPRLSYRIERWSDDGEHLSSLRVEGSGWIESLPDAEYLPEEDPARRGLQLSWASVAEGDQKPRLVGVDEDPSGLLWISGLAVPEDWEPLPETATPADLEAWRDRRWDTVVEVIDPVAGEVIASHREPHVQMFPTSRTDYYIEQQNELGVISFVILRPRLERR